MGDGELGLGSVTFEGPERTPHGASVGRSLCRPKGRLAQETLGDSPGSSSLPVLLETALVRERERT